jgi:hypothetical protein
MQLPRQLALSAAVSLAVFAQTPASAAEVMNLTSTVFNAGTPAAENYTVTSTGLAAPSITVPPTSQFTIGNTFNESGSNTILNNFGASATGSGGPWNFQDNFAFTTSAATVKSTSIAFTSDVSDLQARIISATDPNGFAVPVTTNSNAAGQELVGGPSVVTVINGWTTSVNQPVDYTVVLPKALVAGSYILQVRGEGSPTATYGGTVTFTPVPLPAGFPLLISGLGALAGFGFRKGRVSRDAVPA